MFSDGNRNLLQHHDREQATCASCRSFSCMTRNIPSASARWPSAFTRTRSASSRACSPSSRTRAASWVKTDKQLQWISLCPRSLPNNTVDPVRNEKDMIQTFQVKQVVYHTYLPSKSRILGWNVNGKTNLVFPNGKVLGKTGLVKIPKRNLQMENVRSICCSLLVSGLSDCICSCGNVHGNPRKFQLGVLICTGRFECCSPCFLLREHHFCGKISLVWVQYFNSKWFEPRSTGSLSTVIVCVSQCSYEMNCSR